VTGTDVGVAEPVGVVDGEVERAPGEQVPAQRSRSRMAAAPAGTAADPALGGPHRVGTEGGFHAGAHLGEVDTESTQCRARVAASGQRRADGVQGGAGARQREAALAEHRGGRAGAVPEHAEQEVFVGDARVAQIARLHGGEAQHPPPVRAQPSPERADAVVTDDGEQRAFRAPRDHDRSRSRNLGPCL
jgi:hypothetical protein